MWKGTDAIIAVQSASAVRDTTSSVTGVITVRTELQTAT